MIDFDEPDFRFLVRKIINNHQILGASCKIHETPVPFVLCTKYVISILKLILKYIKYLD